MRELEAAREKLDHGDYPGALSLLLEVWRAVPDPALAAMIEQVGPIAARGRALPIAASDEERDAEWIAAARRGDPADLDMLLVALRDRAVGHDYVLAALTHADPRLSACLVASLIRYAHYPEHLWIEGACPMFEALASCGDPRVLDSFDQILVAWESTPKREVVAAFLATARAALEPATLPPEARALLAEVVPPAEERLDAELLAAIYAAPNEDGPRSIYADYLLQRGDLRGELIALQLARPKDNDPRYRRAYSLVDKHRDEWMGPLARYVESGWQNQFRRGFLAACIVIDPVPDPAWATVESVRKRVPATDDFPMPVLRIARELEIEALEHLATLRTPPPIEMLEVVSLSQSTRARVRAALDKLCLPKLGELRLVAQDHNGDVVAPEDLSAIINIGPIRTLRVCSWSAMRMWQPLVEDSSIVRFELISGGKNVHALEREKGKTKMTFFTFDRDYLDKGKDHWKLPDTV
jgi:uncharacterized protein (TIGR02996 family)